MQIVLINRTARSFALAAVLATPLVLGTSPVLAGPQAQPAAAEKTEAVTRRKTPKEYLAKAEEYTKKAAAYRAEAAAHREMLEEWEGALRGTPRPDEDPDLTKMRIHCKGYIKDAETLAVDAEKFADLYRMQAAALQGK